VADGTQIEWADATWNPLFGCSKVSPGCAHCYAETFALTRMVGKREYTGLPWTPENAAANVQLAAGPTHLRQLTLRPVPRTGP
jgi:protein gp37